MDQLRRHSPFNHITSRQSATLAFKEVPFLVPQRRGESGQPANCQLRERFVALMLEAIKFFW
jgi:hypothetical protein